MTHVNSEGYEMQGRASVHRQIAEKLVGRRLAQSVQIHHIDGNRANNNLNNLVICPDQKYHRLLHARTRVVDAGGDPTTQKICCTCSRLLLKTDFNFAKTTWDFCFPACRDCEKIRQAEVRRIRRERKLAQVPSC